MRPLNDTLIITPIPDSLATLSGIQLVQEREGYPQKGTIVAAGPGRVEKGKRCKMDAKPGDMVYFVRDSGADLPNDDLLVKEGKIVAVISDDEILPYWDKVLVELEPGGETLASGLILLDSEKGYDIGTVLAVGQGYVHEGDRVPMDLSVGDKVAFTQYSGIEIDMAAEDERRLFIVREYDIYCGYTV